MYADCHAGEALHSMDATMVERPPRWAQEPPEAFATGAIRNPEHGRAYAKGTPDEVFTPELYAERAKQVVADLGFSALKFDLDVPTPYQQDTASGTLSRAEIRYMVSLAAAVIDAVGDEVDVYFEASEGETGAVSLSRAKAEQVKVWRDIEQAYNEGLPIEGLIVGKV